MAHLSRFFWLLLVRRSSGVMVLGLLAACQLAVPSTLDEIACTQEGFVGSPVCPTDQVCWEGQCRPCQVGLCPGTSAGSGGEGNAGGMNGTNGQGGTSAGNGGKAGGAGNGGRSGEAGTFGGGSGEGGVSSVGTGGEAGQAGNSAAGSVNGGGSGDSGASGDSGTGGDSGTAGNGGEAGGSAVTPKLLGEECSESAPCQAGLLCLDLAAMGFSKSGSFCTLPCCDSGDCGEFDQGVVCIPTSYAGGMCLPAAKVGRGVPGSKAKGLQCSKDEDCRSAWCDGNVCGDLCCTEKGCSEGKECTVRSVPGGAADTFACGTTSGTMDAGKSGGVCGVEEISIPPKSERNHKACKSGVCLLDFPDTSLFKDEINCTKPCRSSADCSSLDTDLSFSASYCTYVKGGDSTNTVRACNTVDLLSGEYNQTTGAACNAHKECKSNFCANGYCSDTCATDKDCPAPLRCLPVTTDNGASYLLRCFKD